MKKALYSSALCLVSSTLLAADFSGNVALQTQSYFESADQSEQLEQDVSLSVQPKLYQQWNNGDDSLEAEVFARVNSRDEEKNHSDIRQLKWLHVSGDLEWRVGIDTVFWGVTESQNLVDVINQKDTVEGTSNEYKLGQPMIHLTSVNDWGVIDGFILTGFRERTFAGVEGRPRTPFVVDTNLTQYESSDKAQHIDYAIRYSHYIDSIDFAVSYFDGTQRDPLLSATTVAGKTVLKPYYPQMQQLGIELQSINEAWLWKFEGITRNNNVKSYNALTAGFEYTFYGVQESAIDVGTIVEYLHDSRGDAASTPFNNDLFFGARMTFNDIQSTSVLAGMIYDVKNNTNILRVEAERRIGDKLKLSAELYLYGAIDRVDPFKAFEKDNALQIEMAYFF